MSKRNVINIITNLLAMFLSLLINYIVTPLITKELGVAAYSYVGIISSLLSFMSVITYTLNSMVGRFYIIAYNSGNKSANKYISSAFVTCIAIASGLIPVIILATIFLDRLIVIENSLINDVKIAFLLSSISFLLSTVSAVFSTGAYCKNRLDIINATNIIADTTRAVIVVSLFKIFSAHIWYIGLGAIIRYTICIALGYFTFKKLIPEVRFSRTLYDRKCNIDLLSAGVFSSVIMLGNNMINNIDTLVGNRFIENADMVGKYTIILMFITILRSLSSALSSAFNPSTLKIYATGDKMQLAKHANNVVKFCGLALGWPISIIASSGTIFVTLWLGYDFSDFKYILAFMSLPLVANLAVSQLNVVNQAVNKLKIPAIYTVLSGVLNVFLAIILVKYLGLWGIALASVISMTLKNLVATPIYAAYITQQKVTVYYKGLLIPLFISILVCSVGMVFNSYYAVGSFIEFIILCSVLSIIYFLLAWLTLDKRSQSIIKHKLKIMTLKVIGNLK